MHRSADAPLPDVPIPSQLATRPTVAFREATSVEIERGMNATGRAKRYGTVIIGGGQAGLAVGHHLARRGREFVILEAGARIGDSWRNRWDGLRLFTPARYDGLPGLPFPAAPWSLPTKDDVADYLETYARHMDLPVRTGMRVSGLSRNEAGDGFALAAGPHKLEASEVVVASGAYHAPRLPSFAAELAPAIRQFHAGDYRNAAQLQGGPVLVVGASNSGAEIALDAARAHRVVLAGPDKGKMPMRPESRMARMFDPPFWFFINHIATLGTPIGRKARPYVRDHGGPLERIWPADLAAAGVERVFARAIGTHEGRPMLDDGSILDVTNVAWATGFRPDFGWVHIPVFGEDGWPIHVRGVVPSAPGLYFVGLPFLYSAASALLGGVGQDAAHIADAIVARESASPHERRSESEFAVG
jgi:putative flavoprotein involved in K+ transport